MESFVTHLECSGCSKVFSVDEVHSVCSDCGKVLLARYDLDLAKGKMDRNNLADRASNLWRYFELLPVRDEQYIVSLGEGITPMSRARRIEASYGAKTIYLKDEGVNPTGSFKARGMTVAVSKAIELGLNRLVVPSAGNAAGAMAAYCAKAGIEAHVYMPSDTPEANKKEAAIMTSNLTLVKGFITDAGQIARKDAAARNLFDLSTLREPYRLEGKKIMGYEIAADLRWELPEAIIYPTGGGTGIIGIWKAFEEMEALGWIGPERPRMIVVQAEGCAPIVRAFELGKTHADPWEDPETIASGIRVPAAIGDYLILDVVRKSNGTAITVSDVEILEATKQIAYLEGIWPAPEGAATLAGYIKLRESGFLNADVSTLLLNTGTGLKYQELV